MFEQWLAPASVEGGSGQAGGRLTVVGYCDLMLIEAVKWPGWAPDIINNTPIRVLLASIDARIEYERTINPYAKKKDPEPSSPKDSNEQVKKVMSGWARAPR